MIHSSHDQRGLSVTVFAVVVTAALVTTAGLVIDGGQKVSASSRAESAAAGAARAAGNAAATQELAGRSGVGPALNAARIYLAGAQDVSGSVSVRAGVVSVRTSAQSPTIFLSAIGIDQVSGQGFAQANLVSTGHTR